MPRMLPEDIARQAALTAQFNKGWSRARDCMYREILFIIKNMDKNDPIYLDLVNILEPKDASDEGHDMKQARDFQKGVEKAWYNKDPNGPINL